MRTFLLALVAGLFVSGAAHAEVLPSSAGAPRVDQLPSTELLPSEERPMISQGDPAWRWVKLGRSTIGKIGCLSMSVYDTFLGMGLISKSTDPGAFVRMLSAYGLFTPNGELRWDLGKLFPVWVDRFKIFGVAAIQKAADGLSRGAGVLLQVATNHGTLHWVVVSRIINGDAQIRDPNGGRIKWLSSEYGINSIRGMAVLQPQ